MRKLLIAWLLAIAPLSPVAGRKVPPGLVSESCDQICPSGFFDQACTCADGTATTCTDFAVSGCAAPTAPGVRNAMTWSVLGQQGPHVHVGSDAQTNPYAGDTPIDQFLPVLCVLIDGRPAPGGIAFDFYNGWTGGAAQATAPVQGALLTSPQQADALCADTFGPGWRMAEFHDGGGGWSYWAEGQLVPGTRFWVAINDQRANPWNSVGTVPTPVATTTDDLVLKTRLQELMQPVLALAQNPQFRSLVYSGVARRFDGDDNVLLTDVIRDAESAQIVDTNSSAWQAFKAKVAQFQNLNGQAYYPQIYIPSFQAAAAPDSNLAMVVFESALSRVALPAYQLDASGNLSLKAGLVDEAYSELHEVWVLSANERMGLSPDDLATVQALDAMGATSRRSRGRDFSVEPPAAQASSEGLAGEAAESSLGQGLNKTVACNPTGLRNNNGMEYLQSFSIPNPSSVEHWTAGKLEPRVIIVGKGGAEIKNAYFGKIKRKTVANGYTIDPELFITTWDRAMWGDYLAYKWIEIDNGPKIELSLGLSAAIKILLQVVNVSFDVKATFEKKFDDMGSGVVGFNESTYLLYNTGVINWKVCSVGGDGGTGNSNLALSALAAASSSYPGYSAARVNDGSRDTSVGGATSWANADRYAPNGFLPQWVQLDFGTNKTFSRIDLYTSVGYAIQDYRIQVWDSSLGIWLDVLTVAGNTATFRSHTFPARTARLVRILGTRGPSTPNNQPQYVRVNEFEVYQ